MVNDAVQIVFQLTCLTDQDSALCEDLQAVLSRGPEFSAQHDSARTCQR